MIDRKHPHAAFHEDPATRMAREKREDAIYTGACFAVVALLVVVFVWMIRNI